MGEIAEMMLDGILDENGEYIEPSHRKLRHKQFHEWLNDNGVSHHEQAGIITRYFKNLKSERGLWVVDIKKNVIGKNGQVHVILDFKRAVTFILLNMADFKSWLKQSQSKN